MHSDATKYIKIRLNLKGKLHIFYVTFEGNALLTLQICTNVPTHIMTIKAACFAVTLNLPTMLKDLKTQNTAILIQNCCCYLAHINELDSLYASISK